MKKGYESEIQDKVTTFAASVGLLPIRINVTGRRGWPDYGYVHRGRVCFVEYKRPGEHPDPLQVHVHDILIRAGCFVFVVDDIDDGQMKLKQWKERMDATR